MKIAKSYGHLGQHDEAIKVAQQHVDEEKTIDGLIELGDALLAAEKFQEAVNTYREADDFEVRLVRKRNIILK